MYLECDFDGGDCCLSSINKEYCLFCTCYANNNVDSCKLAYAFVGNGVCEDVVNTEVCDYDGGDCCLDEIIGGPYACEFGCICHLDGTKVLNNTCIKVFNTQYQYFNVASPCRVMHRCRQYC